MPLLAGLLQGLFVGLADFFAKYMARKFAVSVAALAAFSTLVITLFVSQMALINSLLPAIPGGAGVQTAIWLAFPDSGPVVIAACLACDASMALYRWNTKNVALVAGAN